MRHALSLCRCNYIKLLYILNPEVTATGDASSPQVSRGSLVLDQWHANPTAIYSISTYKVFDNADLLGPVLSFSSTSTCARLLSTSRTFFEQGIIHVWNHPPTAKPLMLLIPGARVINTIHSRDFIHVSVYNRELAERFYSSPSRRFVMRHSNLDYCGVLHKYD
jgi:hypothetical protein